MAKNWKKFTAGKKLNNFGNQKLPYYLLSLGLQKGRPSYKEAFSSQKRTCSTSKHEISNFFLLLWVIRSGFRIRFQIHWLDRMRLQSGSETLPMTSQTFQVDVERLPVPDGRPEREVHDGAGQQHPGAARLGCQWQVRILSSLLATPLLMPPM